MLRRLLWALLLAAAMLLPLTQTGCLWIEKDDDDTTLLQPPPRQVELA